LGAVLVLQRKLSVRARDLHPGFRYGKASLRESASRVRIPLSDVSTVEGYHNTGFEEFVMVPSKRIRPSRAAEIRRRKLDAQARGLCVTCRKNPAPASRVTCLACSTAAKRRMMVRRAQESRERRYHEESLFYEAAGDSALSRFSYSEASAQFELALGIDRTPVERFNLYDKNARAYLRGDRPERATLWLQKAIEACLEDDSIRHNGPHLLCSLARQCKIESRTSEAIDILDGARQMSNDVFED